MADGEISIERLARSMMLDEADVRRFQADFKIITETIKKTARLSDEYATVKNRSELKMLPECQSEAAESPLTVILHHEISPNDKNQSRTYKIPRIIG